MRAFFLALVLASAGCGQSDDEFLDCEGKCDSVGPLSVSAKWIPVDGFVRAVVRDGGALDVKPADSARINKRDDGRYLVELTAPGFYTLSASGAELMVRVSDNGPTLRVEGAGEFVNLGEQERVELRGAMNDPLGTELTATINGEAIALDGDGAYQGVTREAIFGVNFIELEATDRAGNVFRNVSSFVAAPSYSLEPKPAAVGIGQQALDAIAAELSAELPTLLNLTVPSEPVFSSLGQDVILERFVFPGQQGNPGSIDLTLSSHNGRLRVTASFSGESRVEGVIDGVVSSSDFVAKMQNLQVAADLEFDNSGDQITATTSNVVVTSTSTAVEVVSLIPDFIFEWLTGSLDDHVAGVIKDKFGPWLTGVFASAEGDFNVPAPGSDIAMEYRLASLEPSAGQLAVVITGQVDANGLTRGPGAATRTAHVPTVAGGGDLGIALDYDLINQYLYRLWTRERFRWSWNETDLAEELARVPQVGHLDPIIEVTASAALPPVATLGASGSELSVGELEVEVFIQTSLFQATLKGTIAARADIALPVVDSTLAPTAELLEVHANVEQRAFDGLNVEALEALLVELAPQLFDSLAADLEAIPLPTFDLSKLALDGHELGLVNANSSADSNGISLVGEISIVD